MAPFCFTGAKVVFIYNTPNIFGSFFIKYLFFSFGVGIFAVFVKKNKKRVCGLKISCTFAPVIKKSGCSTVG